MTNTWRSASLVGLAILLGTTAFSAPPSAQGAQKLTMKPFGKTADGGEITLYTLANKKGMEVTIMNYGGVIVSLKVPDRKGQFADVVLGFDSLDGYLAKNPYFGALVGRYANRIGGAQFTLDGKTYHVPKNDGPNCLHGGIHGFNSQVWTAKDVSTKDMPALELQYVSADGEEGFPGKLTATVKYSLNDKDELKIDYSAVTDAPTVLNLTNHSYFNLAGQGNGDILSHIATIEADRFTPVDATLIPTGVLQPVAGTPFDFRKPEVIGARINSDDPQIKLGKGYDHNFVLNHKGPSLGLAARVEEPKSGRVLEVLTDQPGVQFYTGNFLDGTVVGKGGKAYQRRDGFCLETGHFPDSPNKPSFPSTVLRRGETFHTVTVFKFSTK
jgi:aldose 1-epimerase